jgi:hypothetical protein
MSEENPNNKTTFFATGTSASRFAFRENVAGGVRINVLLMVEK